MLQTAFVLAAAIAFPPTADPPAGPLLALSAPRPPCAASIDPSFVRYVPPATRVKGKNPLWLLISGGQAAEAPFRSVFTPPGLGCVRPIQVRDER